ncbi:hypothetical protein ADL21_02805 [Streptomyces albus subsp. albus]|nr:hypothetical protein ADL21_02805 [Streptomyces albus subsp. albus]
MLRRLSGLPQDGRAADIDPLVAPVSEDEARQSGLPTGAPVPAAIRRSVGAALSAPVGTLVERGVVPSAEVLAELVPQLVASTTAQAYEDGALRTLMAATYRAFRNRRSLLLVNLRRQVRVEELPWVRAVAHQRGHAATRRPVHTALRQLGELAAQGFPGTVLPNPLVCELGVLARHPNWTRPWSRS